MGSTKEDTVENLEDYTIVKKAFPESYSKKELTFNLRCEQFTIFDPDSGRYVGPTAFSESAAWHHAAERLRRGEQ
jgi:hypothetical protein